MKTNVAILQRGYARRVLTRLRLKYPEYGLELYELSNRYFISSEKGDLTPIVQSLDDVRPMGTAISIVTSVPVNAHTVDDTDQYENEIWLKGYPLSNAMINTMLDLVEARLPGGTISFSPENDFWIFKSREQLPDLDQERLLCALKKLGLPGEVVFEQVPEETIIPKLPKKLEDKLDLVPSRRLSLVSKVVRAAMERDEDNWRESINRRANLRSADTIQTSISQFACLYDARDGSDMRISELMAMYDRVDVIPDDTNADWLTRHSLTWPSIQELVQLRRLRFVLPFGAENYESQLIETVAEVDPNALILSRQLLSQSVYENEKKQPFLYAPLTDSERSSILGLLIQNAPDERIKTLLRHYARIFESQNSMFMNRGAHALLGCGLGSYLGDVFLTTQKIDARLELASTGASIEWAIGLGANYLPRQVKGFDETGNSLIIASCLGRVPLRNRGSVTERMHTVVDGLLTVADLSPLDVARNLQSTTRSQFRNVAAKLMSGAEDIAELADFVRQLNDDTRAYEKKAQRLKALKIDSLIVGGAMKPVSDYLDMHTGYFTSVAAAWIYEILREHLPQPIKTELETASRIISALATGNSLDAVIVSRSRELVNQASPLKLRH